MWDIYFFPLLFYWELAVEREEVIEIGAVRRLLHPGILEYYQQLSACNQIGKVLPPQSKI